MDGFLPPLIIELVADIREFKAKKNEVITGLHEIGAAGDKVSARISHIATKFANGVLFGAAGALVYGAHLALEFEHHLDAVQLAVGLTADQMVKLKEDILSTSKATSTSANDIADAYKMVEQAGYRGEKATELVTTAAKVSKIAHSDLTTTLKGLMVTQNLHIKGTENATAVGGLWIDSLKQGAKTAEDMTTMMTGKVAIAFKNYGLDLTSAINAQTILSKAQITGTKANMALGGIVEKLEKPSKSTQTILKSLGLSQEQVAKDLRKPNGLINVFAMLHSQWQKLASPADRARGEGAFFAQLFGGRTAAAAQSLLLFAPKFTGGLKNAEEAAKLLNERFKEWQQNTTAGKLANFQTQLQNFEIKLGEHVLPSVGALLDRFNSFLDRLDKDPKFRNTMKHVFDVALGAAIGIKLLPVMKRLGGLFKTSELAANTGTVGSNTIATDENTAALIALRNNLIASGILSAEAGAAGGAAAGAEAGAAGAAGGLMGGGVAAGAIAAAGLAFAIWYNGQMEKMIEEQWNKNTPEQKDILTQKWKQNTIPDSVDPKDTNMAYAQWAGMQMTKFHLTQQQLNDLGRQYVAQGHTFAQWQSGQATLYTTKSHNKVTVRVK